MAGEFSIRARDEWLFKDDILDFKKDTLIDLYRKTMLSRTQKMFKYNGLPDTIPQNDLELIVQTKGSCTWAKVEDKLYVFRSGLGGMPNEYYRPTLSIIANPFLKFNATLKIGEDCVVMRNDPFYQGLIPIIDKAAYLLAEADISFKFAAINIRVPAIIGAPNDNIKEEAKEMFKQIEEGSQLGIIGDDDFFERVNVYDYAKAEYGIQHLIELKQYIIGTFYQDLGIRSSFNMKREAINEAEAGMSDAILFPLCDLMLQERKDALEKVNKMFGTDITVEFDSSWKMLRKEEKDKVDLMQSQIEKNLQEDENTEKDESKEESSDESKE